MRDSCARTRRGTCCGPRPCACAGPTAGSSTSSRWPRARRCPVQVVYSDGTYDMSVFEQRGRLGSEAAPRGGRPVRVGGSKGWQYTWPGGQVVLWQAGRTVYTVVADAPYDDVLGAIRTVKESSGPSVAYRFRQACRSLVGAFRDDR